MGLFDRRKLSTASQTLSLVEDTPELLEQVTFNAIFSQTNSLGMDITESLVNCLGAKGTRFYRYGRDHFTNKLPEGDMGYLSPDIRLVQEELRRIFTQPANRELVVISASLDVLNRDSIAIEHLRKNTDWDYKTNRINVGDVPYIIDFEEAKYSGTTGDIYGRYEHYDPTKPKWDKIYSFTDGDLRYTSDIFYMVEYIINDITDPLKPIQVGNPWYWTYRPKSNVYPELDLPPETKFTQYMPVVPLRINNVSLTDGDKKQTPLYKTSKKLLKKIDLSIEELGEGINGNPEIKDVDHAYFVMGIPIRTTKVESNKYLFEFFNDLVNRSDVTKADFDNWETSGKTGTPPINVLRISDDTYRTKLAYYYITRDTIRGSIGKIGHATKSIHTSGVDWIEESSYGRASPLYYVQLRRQLTENQYVELKVVGLYHSNNIYTTSEDYITTLKDTEEDSLIIPINITIADSLNIRDKNILYFDAMRIVFNAYEWTKLKWYQTGFFQLVTIVVSIAMVAFSWGALSGPAAALLTAVGVGVTVITQFVATVLIKLAIMASIQIVVDVIGIEIAFIIAAIAFIYGSADKLMDLMAEVDTATLIETGMSAADIAVNTGLPLATSIASIGTELMKGIQSTIEDVMKEMQEVTMAIKEETEAEAEKLKKINESLEPTHQLDPYSVFRDVGMIPNESIDQFYARSLYLEAADDSLTLVDNFIDSKFQLTLGE